MRELIYREAVQSDLPTLKNLEQLLIDSERPYDSCIKKSSVTYYDMDRLILEPNTYVLVVESGIGIVGSGYAQIRQSRPHHTHNEYCHIDFIYVEPEYRGKGLAQSIIRILQEWAGNRGIDSFYLEVYAENDAAISAYEKVGFKKQLVTMEYFS